MHFQIFLEVLSSLISVNAIIMDWKFIVAYMLLSQLFSFGFGYLIGALLKFTFMFSAVFLHETECNIKFTDLNKI